MGVNHGHAGTMRYDVPRQSAAWRVGLGVWHLNLLRPAFVIASLKK